MVMDRVYMQHGVKLHEFQTGIKEFDLDNDADVKALIGAHNATRGNKNVAA